MTITEQGSFEEFAQARTPALYRSAYLLCGDRHAAEDLVQDTLAKVYVRWHRRIGSRIDNPAAYAQTTLVRTFVSSRRRRSSTELPSGDLPDAVGDDPSSHSDLRLTLQAALADLTPLDRAVVVLRYLDDLDVETVAARLDLSAGAVRNRSMRALARLRPVLEHTPQERFMTEQDLRDLLRRTTDGLGPDVPGLVAGGAARGRARRRRHLVGTTAAAVLTVGAVAAGSVVLGSGGGSSARDDGFADPGVQTVVDASVATHDDTHRILGADSLSEVLEAMLPRAGGEDGAAGGGSVGSASSDGAGGSASAQTEWRGGAVSVDLSDATPGAVEVAPDLGPLTVDPNGTVSHAGPSSGVDHSVPAGPREACRDAAAADESVTAPCHQVENGDWAYATDGDNVMTFVVADESGVGESGPDTGPAPEDQEGTQVTIPTATVHLFTTDGWTVTASATAPDGSTQPVLGEADLQLMTQDGGWFLDPNAPAPEPSAGPVQSGTVTAVPPAAPSSDAPVSSEDASASDRAPAPSLQFSGIFASLVPGDVAETDPDEATASDPARNYAVSFSWNRSMVSVLISQTGSGNRLGGRVADNDGTPVRQLTSAHETDDGWTVAIQVTGPDVGSPLGQSQLDAAARSDKWFRP